MPRNRVQTVSLIAALAGLLLLAAACGRNQTGESLANDLVPATGAVATPAATAPPPRLALVLDPADVDLAPLPLQAGVPFTITTLIHNRSAVTAENVPLIVHISALEDQFGYQPFVHVLTVTVPASTSVPVAVSVRWNLASGDHRLWLRANNLPQAWQAKLPAQPETDLTDNSVLEDLWIEPFDAQVSTLCAGRVDLEIAPADVLPEPDTGRVLVTIHNLSNRAVYNVPVAVFSAQASGLGYSAAIPACGGTVRVPIELEGALAPGDSLTVHLNPKDWPSGLQEDNLDNNQVTVSAGFAPGMAPPLVEQPADYDFWLDTGAVELAQPGVLVVTVQNRGTRDADGVPVQVENEAGRKVVDRIPLVRGQGLGIGAIRISSLGTKNVTLIVTVNPAAVEGAYPEANRGDNSTSFTLPE